MVVHTRLYSVRPSNPQRFGTPHRPPSPKVAPIGPLGSTGQNKKGRNRRKTSQNGAEPPGSPCPEGPMHFPRQMKCGWSSLGHQRHAVGPPVAHVGGCFEPICHPHTPFRASTRPRNTIWPYLGLRGSNLRFRGHLSPGGSPLWVPQPSCPHTNGRSGGGQKSGSSASWLEVGHQQVLTCCRRNTDGDGWLYCCPEKGR